MRIPEIPPPHIVMVTHGDRLELLKRTVPAILETAQPFVLTIVANAPSARSLDWLGQQDRLLFNLLVNQDNLGFPKAANQGWRLLSEAPYVVHLVDDCLCHDPNWLRKLTNIVDYCPEVGIAGHSVEPVNHLPRMVGEGRHRRVVQVQPSGLGGIILVPERTRRLCGYYSEELGPYGEEDALYGWKVRRAGLLCAYWDHSRFERSFEHLAGGDDDPAYRAWKDRMRAEIAIPARDQLIREYEAGRPLDT